jgi:hypothetical protein
MTPTSQETNLSTLLQTTIAALRGSSELIERFVWSAAPEEAAEAQANNHQAIRALEAARADVSMTSNADCENAPELSVRS